MFPAVDGGWFRVRSTRRVDPEPVKCIRVDAPDHLYGIEGGLLTHNTGGGKSVLERNIIIHVLAHAKEIKLLGIDLKRVELSVYRKYSNAVLGVATTLEDAVEVLNFAQQTMMERYGDMEEVGKNNFLDMRNAGPALLVLIDEAGELLDMSAAAKTDEAKAAQALKGQAQSVIGSIARLGRAAGVFLCIATQRPDAKLIPGELKENLGLRVACGNMKGTASAMVLDSPSATKTPQRPKGRAVMSVYGMEERLQVYFAPQEWIDGWFERHGMNPDGTPLSTGPASLIPDAHGTDKLIGTHLDEIEGTDNADYVAEMKAQDAEVRRKHAEAVAELEANGGMPDERERDMGAAPDIGPDDYGYGDAPAPTDDNRTIDGFKRPDLKNKPDSGSKNYLDEWDQVMQDIHDAGADA